MGRQTGSHTVAHSGWPRTHTVANHSNSPASATQVWGYSARLK